MTRNSREIHTCYYIVVNWDNVIYIYSSFKIFLIKKYIVSQTFIFTLCIYMYTCVLLRIFILFLITCDVVIRCFQTKREFHAENIESINQ